MPRIGIGIGIGRRRGGGYGPELHTSANAASDPNGNEADAITGWNEQGLNGTGANVFESQSAVKQTGDYAFKCDCNDTPTPGARIYWQPTLEDAATYKITFSTRHLADFTGAWRFWIDYGSGLAVFLDISTTMSSFEAQSFNFTMSGTACEIRFGEANGGNNGGIYIDNLSLRKVL